MAEYKRKLNIFQLDSDEIVEILSKSSSYFEMFTFSTPLGMSRIFLPGSLTVMFYTFRVVD